MGQVNYVVGGGGRGGLDVTSKLRGWRGGRAGGKGILS